MIEKLMGFPVRFSPFCPEDTVLIISHKPGQLDRYVGRVNFGPGAFSTSELLKEIWRRAMKVLKDSTGRARGWSI